MTSLLANRRGQCALLLLSAASVLAGCSSGGTTTAPVTTPPVVVTTNPAVVATTILVTDTQNSSLDTYAANANGTVAPTGTVKVAAVAVTEFPGVTLFTGVDTTPTATVYSTGIVNALAGMFTLPDGGSIPANQIVTMTTDSSNNLYVATQTTIYVYKGGTGAPAQTISGALTTMTGSMTPTEMAVDAKGNLYVAEGGGYAGSQVVMFAAGATGNVAPTVITAATYYPSGVALDAAGNIYIDQGSLYSPSGVGLGTAAIYEFAAGSVAGATPMRSITGTNTGIPIYANNIHVDAGGNIFVLVVLNGEADFLIFSPTATGNVAPASKIVRTVGSTTDSQFYLY